MRSRIQHQLRRLQSLRGVAPAARVQAVKSVARSTASGAWKKVRRRAQTGQVRAVELVVGPKAANRYFWRMPGQGRTWFDVENRIERLQHRDTAARDHFVRESIDRTDSASVIAGLSRHPLAKPALRQWLEHSIDDSTAIAARVHETPMLGGAFVGAGRLLLEQRHAASLKEVVITAVPNLDGQMFEFTDSMGFRPSRDPDASTVEPLDLTTVHRFVIGEQFNDARSIALLLPGAKQVSLLATSETFGRFDASPFLEWPEVGDVTVEHVRTRIPRFSQRYVDLHTATAAVADRLVDEVRHIDGLLDPTDRPFLAVEVADFLFFQALKIRAIDVILDDEDIDHVVVALGEHTPTSHFVRLLGGIERLSTDRRVEFISASRSTTRRSQFRRTVDAISRPLPSQRPITRVPNDLVLLDVERQARTAAASMNRFPDRGMPKALLVTANNPAYNDSTAGYIAELATTFDVRVVHIGRNATELTMELAQLPGGAPTAPIQFFVPPAPQDVAALAELLHARLHDLVHSTAMNELSDADRAAWWATHSGLDRVCKEVIAPAVIRQRSAQRWFELLRDDGETPDVVVLTPQRNVSVGEFAAVARRFGVPSVIVEPHAQDANYSRYIKIASDYYGVMSDYFRRNATTGFGIASDRVVSVGSPRQIAPAGYDPDAAQRAARAEYAAETGTQLDADALHLAFFCQPSDWNHVARVWGNVLDAARTTGARVLLKTHPEESVSRVQQYLDEVEARGLVDQVILVDVDAATTIALADIVSTAYSAAAFDAAVRQKPVICIADGDVPYPVDIPAIVGAPLARSADELVELLVAFQSDPQSFRDRASLLLEREPQFVDGPGPRLRELIAIAMARGAEGIRTADELPESLFLDPPHPLFTV